MIVRIWIEDGTAPGLRARLTATLDVSAPGQTVSAASSSDEILATVQAWLDAFLSETS